LNPPHAGGDMQLEPRSQALTVLSLMQLLNRWAQKQVDAENKAGGEGGLNCGLPFMMSSQSYCWLFSFCFVDVCWLNLRDEIVLLGLHWGSLLILGRASPNHTVTCQLSGATLSSALRCTSCGSTTHAVSLLLLVTWYPPTEWKWDTRPGKGQPFPAGPIIWGWYSTPDKSMLRKCNFADLNVNVLAALTFSFNWFTVSSQCLLYKWTRSWIMALLSFPRPCACAGEAPESSGFKWVTVLKTGLTLGYFLQAPSGHVACWGSVTSHYLWLMVGDKRQCTGGRNLFLLWKGDAFGVTNWSWTN
jgi:hypothetical protein